MARQQRELNEQIALFRFLSLWKNTFPELVWIHAIPNFTGNLPMSQRGALALSGRTSGIWDIFVPCVSVNHEKVYRYEPDTYPGMYIEMKIKPNRLTPEQTAFREWAEEQGYRCIVAYDWIEAANAILDYLNIHEPKIRDAIRVNEKAVASL